MSVAERTDALELINDWDELDTPEESAEVQPEEIEDRPDTAVTTQERQPEVRQADPATPVAETQQQPTETPQQQIARIMAENAELQRKMEAREWSSEGRYRAEAKKNEQLTERLKSLEAERTNADDLLRNVAQQRIDQYRASGDQASAQNVQLALENELLKRERTREREDRAVAERHAQELAAEQAERQRMEHGRKVQAAFAPALLTDTQALARQLDLDEADTADLLEFAAPPSLRKLALNAPPEVLGQLAIDQWEVIHGRALALQARKVRRNQDAFDTTRETTGSGATRDLDKEFADADDDEALEMLLNGYEPPQQGKRRRR